MEHGTTQIEAREVGGSASAVEGIAPAAGELENPALAPRPASAPYPAGRAVREFEWSLATYFGQSFVVGAYRAPDRG